MIHRLRNLIACYGAAIAINLELVIGIPAATPQQSNPLVRIDSERNAFDDWHPNEVVTRGTQTRYVVVWSVNNVSAELPTASARHLN